MQTIVCAKQNGAESTRVSIDNGDLSEKPKPGGNAAAAGNVHVKYVRSRLQWLPLDVICLSAVILIVWGLLSLPIIYFHTEIVLESNSSSHLNGSINGSTSKNDFRQTSDNESECGFTCEENFFCLKQNGICVPSCSMWSEYPSGTNTAIEVCVILFACIGLLSAVGVLVLSCVRRKHVFTFPTIFIFYETITVTVLLVLLLLNYMGRDTFYCSSDNLLDSIYERSTPFCTLSGMILYYCMLQLNIWWVFHVTILFWKIQFPIQSLHFSHVMYRAHLLCVILGLSIPLFPVLVTITHSQITDYSAREGLPSGLGFGLATFSPILCYTLDKGVVFYSFILPITLLVVVGITALLLTIWTVHRQHGLFKRRLSTSTKSASSVGVAEKKLLLVFLYFFLLTVVSYTGFSLFHRKIERYSIELMIYFTCEQHGHDPTNPCNRDAFESLAYPGATVVAYILVEIAPIVNFVFVINIQNLKKAFKSPISSQK